MSVFSEPAPGHPAAEFTLLEIKGLCPECGNNSLFLNVTGEIRCRFNECPDSYAASKILAIAVPYHIVRLGESHFSMMHPLKERKEPDIIFSDCALQKYIETCVAPPQSPGLYRVSRNPGNTEWIWTKQ